MTAAASVHDLTVTTLCDLRRSLPAVLDEVAEKKAQWRRAVTELEALRTTITSLERFLVAHGVEIPVP